MRAVSSARCYEPMATSWTTKTVETGQTCPIAGAWVFVLMFCSGISRINCHQGCSRDVRLRGCGRCSAWTSHGCLWTFSFSSFLKMAHLSRNCGDWLCKPASRVFLGWLCNYYPAEDRCDVANCGTNCQLCPLALEAQQFCRPFLSAGLQ